MLRSWQPSSEHRDVVEAVVSLTPKSANWSPLVSLHDVLLSTSMYEDNKTAGAISPVLFQKIILKKGEGRFLTYALHIWNRDQH